MAVRLKDIARDLGVSVVRVSSPMSAFPRSTFETVTTETPRSRAMSFNLTAIVLLTDDATGLLKIAHNLNTQQTTLS
jgi:hypothetical protein